MIGRADKNGPQGSGVAEDVSFTENTIDRHAVAYNIGSYHSNAWKSDNPNSGVYATEVSKTLDALQCGSPTCNQGGTAVVEPIVLESNQNHATVTQTGVSPTLPASAGMGGGYVPMVVEPTVLDMTHADEVIRDCGDVVPTLQSRMGTGGNQIPLVQQEATMRDGTQTCPTLTANNAGGNQRMPDMGNFNAVLDPVCCVDRAAYEEVQPAQLARQYKDPPLINATAEDCRNASLTFVVRRLTPLECTRLQGFPDGWLDIGDWVDSKGKLHKDSDTPKYKALGNSIALPFWLWLAERISAQFDHPCTLGSLFDGIGGFPLVFEYVNGVGTARWASEIEEFPIAVTKHWFEELDLIFI